MSGLHYGWMRTMVLVPKQFVGASRCLSMTPNKSKDEKAAVIMRLRRREEETKKYGAPAGQALIIGVCGLLALAAGGYGLCPSV